MRYLTLHEVLMISRRVMQKSGGTVGLANLEGLESALTQPYMTFGSIDLYPTMSSFL